MSLNEVYALDIVVLGILLLSAIVAWSRGFVREVLSLAAWVGAAVAVYYGFRYVRPYARDLIATEMFADAAAVLVIFILALFLLTLIFGQVAGAIGNSRHGALDRSLGFLFGLFRGALLVCLAYLVVSWAVPPDEQPVWMAQARTIPLIREGAREIERLIPPEAEIQGRALAGQADRDVRRAAEGERLLQRFNNPAPIVVTKPGEAPGGYEDRERRDMERLIRGTQ